MRRKSSSGRTTKRLPFSLVQSCDRSLVTGHLSFVRLGAVDDSMDDNTSAFRPEQHAPITDAEPISGYVVHKTLHVAGHVVGEQLYLLFDSA